MNVNETKKMIDKLNAELESLRSENKELKLRLAKYEVAEEDSCNTEELQDLMSMTVAIDSQRQLLQEQIFRQIFLELYMDMGKMCRFMTEEVL